MEALVLTQLSIPEIRQLFRQELVAYFSEAATQSAAPQNDRLLTVTQAAEFLSLATPTIYSLVSRNEIVYMKRGKRLYFSEQELTAWLKGGRKEAAEAKLPATTSALRGKGPKKGGAK
ncbi:helix-turn-helix domain-containing protein [Rufibacter sp. XAAS-G3-1]|uniref:helix-turn-helix domain-containing protein n=1 Tax=Rufibacter sp. XAAS-G3-1 TaxID=2729134 RepID=UPI0015E67031|nr:helix-turn-helix domain-containing protein [Rufibacter sp. XAAS-G3-1]